MRKSAGRGDWASSQRPVVGNGPQSAGGMVLGEVNRAPEGV